MVVRRVYGGVGDYADERVQGGGFWGWMANLISEFGTEDHPAGDEWFYGVPWEQPEGFLNSSPFVHLKKAKTPTLVLQGDADTVDPLGRVRSFIGD